MTGFHTAERLMPRTNALRDPVQVRVWCAEKDGVWAIQFGDAGGGQSTAIWTTREGIEAVRDSCNEALVRGDADSPHDPPVDVAF